MACFFPSASLVSSGPRRLEEEDRRHLVLDVINLSTCQRVVEGEARFICLVTEIVVCARNGKGLILFHRRQFRQVRLN